MKLIIWHCIWLLDWYALRPIRMKRRRWGITVTVAGWAHNHQHRWLERLVYRYWRLRNRWRDVWWRDGFTKWRFHLLDPLRPKCKNCHRPLHDMLCTIGMFENAFRKARLEQLTAGRQRYGSRP